MNSDYKIAGMDRAGEVVEEFGAIGKSTVDIGSVAPASSVDTLHAAIMNLPCDNPYEDDNCGLYNHGHRAARHAAAELVSALVLPSPVSAAPVDQTTQCMADCMDMVRRDLIEMGVIDKSVAPMFIPEAIAAYVKRVAAPVVPVDRNAVLEECAALAVEWGNARVDDGGGHALRNYAAAVRALKSAAPASVPVEVAEVKKTSGGQTAPGTPTVTTATMDGSPAINTASSWTSVPQPAVPRHTIQELLALYDANNGDWCGIARAVEDRFTAAPAVALPAAQGEALDAARWRETVRRIGYLETGAIDGPAWTLDLPAPRRHGNTDENFIAAIDAARATPDQPAVTQQEGK